MQAESDQDTLYPHNPPTSIHSFLHPGIPSCPSLTNFSLLGQQLPRLADDCNLLGKLQMENFGTFHRLRDSESPGMGPGNLRFENLRANGKLSFGNSDQISRRASEILHSLLPPNNSLVQFGFNVSLCISSLIIHHPSSGDQPRGTVGTASPARLLYLPASSLRAGVGFSCLHLQHATKGHSS